MILKWAAYGLVVAFAAYEAVVFENVIVSMLFVLILLWPLLTMISLCVLRRRMEVSLRVPVPVAEKRGRIQIQVTVRENSWLPILHMDAYLRCQPVYGGADEVYPLPLSADGGKVCQYIYEISRDSCGRLRLEMERVRLWDYLHFFSVDKRLKLSEEITFLPQIYETAVTVCEATRHFAGETEDYEPEAAGPDPSQTYQVREYRPGDRLQMIHWKLTARNDDLFVRESSEPVCFAVGIFMDLSGRRKEAGPMMEGLLETVLSISNGLLEQKCRHFMVWYDASTDRLIKRRIGRMEDIFETTEYLMTAESYEQPVDMLTMYRERYPYGLYAVAVQVDLSGSIRREDEVIGHYDSGELEKSLSELLIQV